MLHSIENEWLKLTVNDEGGSMHSLIYKPTGEERLWPGGEAWASRDVVIFPIIGHAGAFEVCGKSYALRSHGLARYARFSAENRGGKLVLSFSSDEDTRALYPFDFDFSVSYELEENAVKVGYRVRSKGGVMPFYVGGHPGCTLPAAAQL